MLDVFTLRRTLGGIDGASIWIVGDVLHSRVARSNVLAFREMGAKVTLCGPPTLIPRGIEALGCDVRFTLDELPTADVVYALRMQVESGIVVRMAVLYEVLASRAVAPAPTPEPSVA